MPTRWLVAIVLTLTAIGAVLWYSFAMPGASAPEPPATHTEVEAERADTPATPPTPTLAEIAADARDFHRNNALYELLAGADAARLQALLAEAPTLPAALHRYDISRVLYLRFVSLDPASAVEHLLANTAKPSWVNAVFRAWAHKDFDAAVAHAATLGPLARHAAAEAILELDISHAQREAAAALMYTPAALANAVLWEGRLFEGRDLAEAWRLAEAIPKSNWKERRRLLREMAEAWARTDPFVAMAAIEALDAITREKTQPHALRAWAEVDPHAAMDWVLAREPHKRPQELVAAAMESLAAEDTDAAMTTLATMPEPARGQALSAVLSTLVDVAPDESIALYQSLAAHEKAQVSMRDLAYPLGRAAPDQALSWALDLPDDVRGTGLMLVAWGAHDADRESLLRKIGAMDDPALQHRVANQIVGSEVDRDPLTAWRWATSLAPISSGSAASAVFRRWHDRDPEAALDALTDTPRGEVRDRVLEEAVRSRVTFHPAQAEALFEHIDSAPAKARAARSLVHYYTNVNSNAEKAEQYGKFAEDDEGEDKR